MFNWVYNYFWKLKLKRFNCKININRLRNNSHVICEENIQVGSNVVIDGQFVNIPILVAC